MLLMLLLIWPLEIIRDSATIVLILETIITRIIGEEVMQIEAEEEEIPMADQFVKYVVKLAIWQAFVITGLILLS